MHHAADDDDDDDDDEYDGDRYYYGVTRKRKRKTEARMRVLTFPLSRRLSANGEMIESRTVAHVLALFSASWRR